MEWCRRCCTTPVFHQMCCVSQSVQRVTFHPLAGSSVSEHWISEYPKLKSFDTAAQLVENQGF